MPSSKIFVNTTLNNKKNAYRSYIVPILSYDSQPWKPSKSDLTWKRAEESSGMGFWFENAIIQM